MNTMDISDASAICRTCLDCCEGLESLEEENELGISLKEMLLSFTTIHLNDKESSLYNAICKECSIETLRAYHFKLKCEQSDVLLHEKLQNLKKEDMKFVELKVETIDPSTVKEESVNIGNMQIKIEDGFDYQSLDYIDPDVENYQEYNHHKSYSKRTKRKKSKKSSHHLKSERNTKKNKRKMKYSSDDDDNNEEVNQDSDDNKDIVEHLPRIAGRPGRKKKIRPDSETKLIDESATSLGYKKIYECHKCHAFFKTFRMLHKHMIKLHQIALDGVQHFNRLWDDLKAKDETKITDEKVAILDFKNPRYKCLDCIYMCKSFEIMKKHIINEHRGERYIHCDECEYKTTHLTMFVRHKRMHTGERRFACNECDYKSSSNYQLNLHIAALHTEHRAFVCDVCAQAFKTKLSLLNHITRVHINKREHICQICYKGFNMKKDLKNHTLIHSGQRPHVCEHCGMAFTQKANLEKHVHVIHLNTGERPFPCPECNYRAKSVYSLKSHMYRHNRTKHYPCHLCSHKATTKYALKVHVQRHLGDKRHQCKSCPYSCYDAQTLLVHNRIHTGERPFPCGVCPYRSRTKQRLRNHMKSHLNEQKYSCQHCPYRSNYKSNLIVHLKKNCGRDSRPYTPRKNPAAIDFSLLPTNVVNSLNCTETQERTMNVPTENSEIGNQLKVEMNANNVITMG